MRRNGNHEQPIENRFADVRRTWRAECGDDAGHRMAMSNDEHGLARVSFEDLPSALEDMEDRSTIGRIVVRIAT